MKKTLLFLAISSVIGCSHLDNKNDDIAIKNNNPKTKEIATEESEVKVAQDMASPVYSKKESIIVTGHRIAGSTALNYHQPLASPPITNRENYNHFDDNGVKLVGNDPVSTFSIDVDTGAYSNMRRMLNQGIVPPHDAIRVEELINYFDYSYPTPEKANQPFTISTELASSPWNDEAQLMHIGIQGYDIDKAQRPASNLTFLIDVSGSMNSSDKLGLLKSSFKLMTKNLTKNDKVSIVVYAGAAGTVLEPTSGDQKSKIIQALDKLSAGGSTNGAAGIKLAYQLNEDNFIQDGINRVIIATDGDVNVGTTNFEQLTEMVERKKEKGIALTTLGFGTGNYNDHLMEQLANKGNGNYAYIDTLKEANKVLVNEMSSTLMTIAKDVKIQIEFNPLIVSQYRLIGYENRVLNNEDFNNDKIDAGEIGAGHSVTALYEVILNGSQGWIEPLKYQSNEVNQPYSDELATLKVRYKQPDSDTSELIVQTINRDQLNSETSNNFKLSAAVAGMGQLLRGGKMTKNFSFTDVQNLVKQTLMEDKHGYRGEFLQLVSLAESLTTQQANHVE
ncbi:MAG: von Willebrand factor type A domain-containing protein [Marinicellaceae bacterium]